MCRIRVTHKGVANEGKLPLEWPASCSSLCILPCWSRCLRARRSPIPPCGGDLWEVALVSGSPCTALHLRVRAANAFLPTFCHLGEGSALGNLVLGALVAWERLVLNAGVPPNCPSQSLLDTPRGSLTRCVPRKRFRLHADG